MAEQPVALATCMWSPNSCEISFRYGVSPQPAQAPLNSNSGSRNCTPRTLAMLTWARSALGRVSKNARWVRSRSRMGSFSPMLMARCLGSVGLMAGQASTHTPQPVQSST